MTVSTPPLEDLTVELHNMEDTRLYEMLEHVSNKTGYRISVLPKPLVEITPGRRASRYAGFKFIVLDVNGIKRRSASFACIPENGSDKTMFNKVNFDYTPDIGVDQWGCRDIALSVGEAMRDYLGRSA